MASLVALVAIELTPIPPWRWRDVLPTSAHRWLSAQTGPISVVDCVPSRFVGQRVPPGLFGHDIRLLTGWEDCGDPDFGAKLADRGTSHMLVRSSGPLAGWLLRHGPQSGLRLQEAFDDSQVYAVGTEIPALYLEVADGFHWREYSSDRSYRWLTDRGRMTLVNTTGKPLEAVLEMELQAFPRARALTISMDGRMLDELAVYPLPRRQTVEAFRVEPGRHTLELDTRTPAMVADEFLGNGDQRALAIALGQWTVSVAAD